MDGELVGCRTDGPHLVKMLQLLRTTHFLEVIELATVLAGFPFCWTLIISEGMSLTATVAAGFDDQLWTRW